MPNLPKALTRDQFIELTPGSIITNEHTNHSYKIVYVMLCARAEMEVLWAEAINVATNERVKITYHHHWIKSISAKEQKVAA